MSLLPAILAVSATLAAASIAAFVALYAKRLERWNAAEQRHSEAREKAYESFLATCDCGWHFRLKSIWDSYMEDSSPSQEEIDRVLGRANLAVVASLEDLQRHSRDYKRADPLLLRLYGEAFERRYPKLTEFENARVAVQDLQRYESGLRKQLGHVRKKSVIQELRARRQSRHTFRNLTAMRIVGPEGDDETILYQGDGEAIWALVQENMREWDDVKRGIAMQESRAARWKQLGLWHE